MSENDSNVFTAEFRHEQVIKFVKGVLDGSVKLPMPPPTTEEQLKQYITKLYSELTLNIVSYVSGKISSEELDALEGKIFYLLVTMKVTGAVTETVSRDQILEQFDVLNQRMDSNNMLLLELVKGVRDLVNKLDK